MYYILEESLSHELVTLTNLVAAKLAMQVTQLRCCLCFFRANAHSFGRKHVCRFNCDVTSPSHVASEFLLWLLFQITIGNMYISYFFFI